MTGGRAVSHSVTPRRRRAAEDRRPVTSALYLPVWGCHCRGDSSVRRSRANDGIQSRITPRIAVWLVSALLWVGMRRGDRSPTRCWLLAAACCGPTNRPREVTADETCWSGTPDCPPVSAHAASAWTGREREKKKISAHAHCLPSQLLQRNVPVIRSVRIQKRIRARKVSREVRAYGGLCAVIVLSIGGTAGLVTAH